MVSENLCVEGLRYREIRGGNCFPINISVKEVTLLNVCGHAGEWTCCLANTQATTVGISNAAVMLPNMSLGQ